MASAREYNSRLDDFDDFDTPPLSRQEMLQRQKEESMSRQLEATQRCMTSIYDSQSVGIATAEELVRQGEQLDNIEEKAEKINADTRISQRHLNGIKSIFGGLKNWWQGDGKKDDSATTTTVRSERTIAGLNRDQLDKTQSSSLHPALRLRSENSAASFYDDDVQTFDANQSFNLNDRNQASPSSAVTQQHSTQAPPRSAAWQQYEGNLNKNLDTMSSGLSQLKQLAQGLNLEIETQNDQLERIMPKVERADTKVRDQNRQMKKILGNK